MLIAAIDPAAEAELDGLNKALVSGRYLTENESGRGPILPVLASSASGMDEYAQTTLQQLAAPSVMPDMNAAGRARRPRLPAARWPPCAPRPSRPTTPCSRGSGRAATLQSTCTGTPVAGYWSVGPVDYQRTRSGALAPRQVVNRPSVWDTGNSLAPVAMDDEDSQYRTVTSHAKCERADQRSSP